MKRFVVAVSLMILGSFLVFANPRIIVSHALSLHGKPKYPADFTHFDYANPDAPKGGTLRLSSIGTYDNFNLYAQRGLAADGSAGFYDTLMTPSEDEIEVYYGLIADEVQYPDDYTWIVFHINPKARNQDGSPITADEVVFSFDKFLTQGVPFFKQNNADVTKVEALDTQRVKFTLRKSNKALMVSLAQLTVLPKSYWEKRDLSEPLTEVPPGSGPYTVKDYKMGQYVVYQRVPDYWAAELPVNKGQLNFDFLRYDFYRDETVAFEAFKAGEYDLYQENIAKNWATMYKGKNFDSGAIIREEIPHQIPQPTQALVFNVQRPLFSDRKVRQALTYALDFEWMNKNLFYDQYTRTRSYFTNTEYEARGLPSVGELKYLAPLRGKIPDEVFTQEYDPPVTDGTGNIRPQMEKAFDLLKDAGWEVKDLKLVNVKTGDPFTFELLMYSPSEEKIALAFQRNLARLGITMKLRIVDVSQFTNRLRTRDFDMISQGYLANFYPSLDLRVTWRSDYIDSTYNTAGVKDPAVDSLIDQIVANQENEDALLDLGRALDRVLTWNFYITPEWYLSKFRVAYWNRFSRPEVRPKYSLGIESWWFDKEKDSKLPKK
jgi:microcin C transport system substrate-binding protein